MELADHSFRFREPDLLLPRRAFPSTGSSIRVTKRSRCSPCGGDSYAEHGVYARGARAASPLLQGFSAAVADVFGATNRKPVDR